MFSVVAAVCHNGQVYIISVVSRLPLSDLVLLQYSSRTAHSNNFKLDSALPWVLSNTSTKSEVDWNQWFLSYVKDIHTDERTDRQTDSGS